MSRERATSFPITGAALSMPSTLTNLLYHIVFSTKDRQPLIAAARRDELYRYIGGIIRNEKGILLEIGGMPDHVHLLLKIPADLALSTMVRLIKSNSSKWMNEKDKRIRFAWQAGYGAFTVSESQAAIVQRYIQKQDQHHRRATFQQEFVKLLELHGIEYDPNHLWS
jgi:REP element-mobilizing transposase RayT